MRSLDRLGMTALLGCTSILSACTSALTPEKMAQIKPAMKVEQVEALLGHPARIDQSETTDTLLRGETWHYPASNGEGRVVFLNDAVFKAEFIPQDKKS